MGHSFRKVRFGIDIEVRKTMVAVTGHGYHSGCAVKELKVSIKAK